MIHPENALDRINTLSIEEAQAEFRRCCGASLWAARMSSARPFHSEEELTTACEAIWPDLSREQWLEAFDRHPRIGDREALRAKYSSPASWEAGEQSGARHASEEVLEGLERGNREYEARFGYIFIVCATGKSAEEMLALLQSRLPNDPDKELAIAAEEQKKITRLRLRKLLNP